MMKILVLLGLFVVAFGFIHFEIEPIDMARTKLNVVLKRFKNLKDHFKNRRLGTFEARYWEMANYFKPGPNPKVILYICGESQGRFPAENTLPVLAAQKANAMVYSLEHRFYGESQLAADWSEKSLELLTFQQALADIAYFIESKNFEFKKNYMHTKEPKWVVIGGSYAGAMAAWFRYKYPHLAVGAISSSGVVNAIDDFYHYEMQVVEDVEKCGKDAVKKLKAQQDLAAKMINNRDKKVVEDFLKMINAEGMTSIDFLYYYADVPVTWIQKGLRNDLCSLLNRFNGTSTLQEVVIMAWEAAILNHTADSYRMSMLKDTKIDSTKHSRQWYYQVCTTFGWFQTPYKKNPIRPINMSLDEYWRPYCIAMFPGKKVFPNVNYTNHMMSGLEIEKHTSNTFFTPVSYTHLTLPTSDLV
eukprot:TRINITY_DN7754_c0_g3_i7.p1 TRINITY_DN7754_c0_g3~~TRINITY_DN7754_c0_g3_i7.p1  ORF type:complete len:426 (-),score=72.17 TRINITY_DN7754_c0_g3_i7:43-1287(-)